MNNILIDIYLQQNIMVKKVDIFEINEYTDSIKKGDIVEVRVYKKHFQFEKEWQEMINKK